MTSASNYSTAVQELYVAYFGRPADFFGLQNFETALSNANAPTDLAHLAAAYNTNPAVRALVDSFGASTESQNLFGPITDSTTETNAFVNAIFENLFGRNASSAGLNFWSNAITSHSLTPSDAALAIAAGAAANTSAQGLIDAATVANKVSVATDFTTEIGQSSQNIVDYSGPAAAAYVRSMLGSVTATTDLAGFATTISNTIISLGPIFPPIYTLTTGLDNITTTEGHAAFNAVTDNAAGLAAGGQSATLNTGDSIVASTQAGSVNTLRIVDFGLGSDFAVPGGVTLTGITALHISSLEGVADQSATNGSLDFSNRGGLNQFSIDASTGNDNITAPTSAVVSVADKAGDITVHGGASIFATDDGTSIITIDGGSATKSVNLTGGGASNGNVITDLHFGTGVANTITSVSLTNGIETVINSDALNTLSLSGNGNDATVNAAAGTRTLALTVNGGSVGTFTDNSATTLNISASGSDTNFFSIDAASAKTISFNDSVDLSLTRFSAPQASSVTITGQGSLIAVMNQVGTAPVIDASGSGGSLGLTFGNGTPVHLTGGSGSTQIFNSGANVLNITLGSASDSVANGAGTYGTVSFATHTAADQISVGANAASNATPDLTHILAVSGLNNVGLDTVTFNDGEGTAGASFQQITAAQVTASGALTTTLAGWVAAATGLGNSVQQSAHGVVEFQFGGNTYLVETATTTDAGVISAHDAIVELTGTGFTFAHTSTINGGVLNLAG